MSTDPGNAGVDPTNPQTWNLYLYTHNDPINFVDPSGLEGRCIHAVENDSTVWCISMPDDPFRQLDSLYMMRASGGGMSAGFGENTDTTNVPNSSAKTPSVRTQVSAVSQCVDEFYKTSAGSAVAFGSPLALVPGWNPGWGHTLQEWVFSIASKAGGLLGLDVVSPSSLATS
jgi:hypothetical protein